MTRLLRIAAAGLSLMVAACRSQLAPDMPTPARVPGAAVRLTPLASVTSAQRRWIDSTLSTLSRRERVAQLVMVWVLGDYTNTRDSTYAEIIRWVEDDRIGGVSMSLGTPVEVAAKLNDLQRRARVPLLVAADLEPGLGRLEGGLFAHYLLD